MAKRKPSRAAKSAPASPITPGGWVGIILTAGLAIGGFIYLSKQKSPPKPARITEPPSTNRALSPALRAELLAERKKRTKVLAKRRAYAEAVRAYRRTSGFEMESPEAADEILEKWKDVLEKSRGTKLEERVRAKVAALQKKLGAEEEKEKPFPGLLETTSKAKRLAWDNQYRESVRVINNFIAGHEGYQEWRPGLEELRRKVGIQWATHVAFREKGAEALVEAAKFDEAIQEYKFLASFAPPPNGESFAQILEELPARAAEHARTMAQQAQRERSTKLAALRDAFQRISRSVRKMDVPSARTEVTNMSKVGRFAPIREELAQANDDLAVVQKLLADARLKLPSLQGRETAIGGQTCRVLRVDGNWIYTENQGVKTKKRITALRDRELYQLLWGKDGPQSPKDHLSAGLFWLYRHETAPAEQEFLQAKKGGLPADNYLGLIEILGRSVTDHKAGAMLEKVRKLAAMKEWRKAAKLAKTLQRQSPFSLAYQGNLPFLRPLLAIEDAFGTDPLLHPAKVTVLENGFVDCLYDFNSSRQMIDWTGDGPQPGFWLQGGRLVLTGLSGQPRAWLKAGFLEIASFEFDVRKGEDGSDYVAWELGWDPGSGEGLLFRFGRSRMKSYIQKGEEELGYGLKPGFADEGNFHPLTSMQGKGIRVTVNGTNLMKGDYAFALPGRAIALSTGYNVYVDNVRFVARLSPDWTEFAMKQRAGNSSSRPVPRGQWVPLLPGGKAIGWEFEPEVWSNKDSALCLDGNEGMAEFAADFKNFELRGQFRLMSAETEAVWIFFRRHLSKFQCQYLEIVPYDKKVRLKWNYLTRKKPYMAPREQKAVTAIEPGKWHRFHLRANRDKVSVTFNSEDVLVVKLPAVSGRFGIGGKGGGVYFKDLEVKKLP